MPQDIAGMIGPNEVGQTTTFNIVSGYYTPTEARVRTFQNSTLFKEFTLLQNVLVGRYIHHHRPTLLGAILGTEARAARENEALAFFGLLKREDELAAEPDKPLHDELSMGLAPVIEEISKQGVAAILVEQNAELALELADHAYVLETGGLVIEGRAKDLHESEHARRAYLGA